jgi:PAS domain-containing protein
LIGTDADITDSKRAEEALRESEEKYREQSIMLETVLNSIPDVLGVQELDHSIIRYNEAGYRKRWRLLN